MYKNKKFWKRGISVVLAGTMVLGSAVCVYADGTGDVVVEEGDKPYVALGADLSSSDRATVLELMGLTENDLENCSVVTVTNDQEHEYLDSYMSSDTIGTRALSSVLVMEGDSGSGIQVTTKNITYCTTGMYQNALATAGVEDAEVIVAGPFDISGTAALIGAIEAYSVMTGDEVDTDVIDGAVDEIVTTGELESSIDNADSEEVEGMIAYLKDQMSDGDMSDSEMDQAIEEASDKFGVELTDDEKQQIKDLLKKLQGLDLDWDKIADAAQNFYDQMSANGYDLDSILNSTETQGFFQKIISFFKSLFGSSMLN